MQPRPDADQVGEHEAEEDIETVDTWRWASEARQALKQIAEGQQKHKALRAAELFLQGNGDTTVGGNQVCYLQVEGNLSTIKDKPKKGAAFAGIEKPGIKDLGGNKLSVEFLHWRHRQKLQAFLELVPGIKAVCMTVPRQRYMRQYLKSWSSEMHCSQLAFGRLVADIVRDHRPQATTKLTTEAVACLQLAAEEYITCFLNNAWSLSLHAKRKTLMLTDLRLAQRRSQDGKKEIANCLPELPKRKRRRVEAA